MIKEKFLVPDYYPAFSCKGGACRHSCCNGYEVDISQTEYFRLLGVPCSEQLRRRLDGALHEKDERNAAGFAQLCPSWDGGCPMLQKSGLCDLQAECGAEALPSVCRYYPRSPRMQYRPECACANACEAVLELLFAHREPLAFRQTELCFELPAEKTPVQEAVVQQYGFVREQVIAALQNRSMDMASRLAAVCKKLAGIVPAETRDAAVQAAEAVDTEPQWAERTLPPAGEALQTVLQLLDWSGRMYPTMATYTAQVRAALPETAGVAEQQDILQKGLTAAHRHDPELPLYFEQMLVNHVFYTGFPYQEPCKTFVDTCTTLTVAYAMLEVLTACCTLAENTMEDYTDLCATFFRFAEFTDFSHNMRVLIHRCHADFWRPEAFLAL